MEGGYGGELWRNMLRCNAGVAPVITAFRPVVIQNGRRPCCCSTDIT